MYKLAWGSKKTCQECESRFYDLGKSPATCPKCGAVNETFLTTRRKSGGKKIPSLSIVDTEILKDEDTIIEDDTLLEEVDDDSDLDIVVHDSAHVVDDEDA